MYDHVKKEQPGLFNALNLATLQLGRPAALEAPELCTDFETGEEYLHAWRAWSAARNGVTPKLQRKRSYSARRGGVLDNP